MTMTPEEREIRESVESLERGFSVGAAHRLVAALERKHGITTTVTTDRTPCAIGQRVYCPRIDTPEALAVWLHEAGHVISGPCPDRAPHRRDPTVMEAWQCLECENLASNAAMTLAPFSPQMHQRLARGMQVYLRTTPAPAAAKTRALRFVNGVSWRETLQRRLERERRLEQQQELTRYVERMRQHARTY
jgi:hypothetical protein